MSCDAFTWSLTTTDLITAGFIVFKLFDTASQVSRILTQTGYNYTDHPNAQGKPCRVAFQYSLAAFVEELTSVILLTAGLVATVVVLVTLVYWKFLWDAYVPHGAIKGIGVWLCDAIRDEHNSMHYNLYIAYYIIVSLCVAADLVCVLWALLIAPSTRSHRHP